MKLKHIHIDAYKVFRDFDIDFCYDGKVQNLIIITGINGNGKTTLLRDVIAEKDSRTAINGYMEVEDAEKTVQILLSLPDNHIFSNIVLYKADEFSSVERLQNEIIRYVDKQVYEQGKTSFEAYNNIQTLIENIFPNFNLQIRFKGINRDKKLIFTNLSGDEFGIDGLSGGERQILSKIFPLFTDDMKGHVILFDEPEESLHPSWQNRLVPILRKCAKDNDCQFIIATHSPQIISAARKEEIRILKRNDKGVVQAGTCMDGPYGWTVEKVLTEIQDVDYTRVPEVEEKLLELFRMLEEGKYDTAEFKEKLSYLESAIGFTDRDLALIRMEIIRRKKKL